ncbi:mucin-5AC-like [Discoglossus pictus]
MNHGKLDLIKHKMTRLDFDILGISELKRTGMGHLIPDRLGLLMWSRILEMKWSIIVNHTQEDKAKHIGIGRGSTGGGTNSTPGSGCRSKAEHLRGPGAIHRSWPFTIQMITLISGALLPTPQTLLQLPQALLLTPQTLLQSPQAPLAVTAGPPANTSGPSAITSGHNAVTSDPLAVNIVLQGRSEKLRLLQRQVQFTNSLLSEPGKGQENDEEEARAARAPSGGLRVTVRYKERERLLKKMMEAGAIPGAPGLVATLDPVSLSAQTGELVVSEDALSFFDSNLRLVKSIGVIRHKICSTWGNFHFKTFDGAVFYYPGTCNYVLSSHCKSSYEDFNIQIRRTEINNVVTFSKISMKIDAILVEVSNNSVIINGKSVELPYSELKLVIQKIGVNIKISSKLGLVLKINEDNSLLLQIDSKYANSTCGICGDFNGDPMNEFINNGVELTEIEYGNFEKKDGPNEQCKDPDTPIWKNCNDTQRLCESILTSASFSSCNDVLSVQPYLDACVQDLCLCEETNISNCVCSTIAEYSRECAYTGGKPGNWRTSELCPKTCPYNMEYLECGSPCEDSCFNPMRTHLCDDMCTEGCYCRAELLFDDINTKQCIPIDQCSCTYNGQIYLPGSSYKTSSSHCICNSGKWNCTSKPCPGTCAITGGSHIKTYDDFQYTIYGSCGYVLSKVLCDDDLFSIFGELRPCARNPIETCLRTVTVILNGGEICAEFSSSGDVYVNMMYTQLPFTSDFFTIFRSSPLYVIFDTTFGLQMIVEILPVMQLYIVLDTSFKGETCGLCGNFNNMQTDEFRIISGVVEGNAVSFVNTWKIEAGCPSVTTHFDDPCSTNAETEAFAKHWCGLLLDPFGVFSSCHNIINPSIYYKNCMLDTCSCEKSEDCMCAALSSYAKLCASKNVILTGWRDEACTSYTDVCPNDMIFSYSVTSCQPTCRSLSEQDITCKVKFDPIEGCICKKGLYLDNSGNCVPAIACPCYYKGSAFRPGATIEDPFGTCTCKKGRMYCVSIANKACTAPMIFIDCRTGQPGMKGAQCFKNCHTLDMQCYGKHCISGCVCPEGLVSDDKGGCIDPKTCPCIHNGAMYKTGEKITIRCNTCVCKDRMWKCTNNTCLATCTVYGDGNYITFDGKFYNFNGDCEYTLAQDHCSADVTNNTFTIITENIPCGTGGTTCSKSIKMFLGSYEIIFANDRLNVIQRGTGTNISYVVRLMGIYLVLETNIGLLLMWDKKTSLFIKVTSDYKGKLCGLCGNYDGDANNDFTTRSNAIVENIEEFGTSWKLSKDCPDPVKTNPCILNPYRMSWSHRKCSIINSNVFSACHPYVDPSKYYDACVSDSCACNSGGDCECFCTAVAAYSLACGDLGICIAWRTPNICPLFCDYYNMKGECEWHYKPCGAPCMKTCRNPSGKCAYELRGLEGCYPKCPEEEPLFDEDIMECVSRCGCYDEEGKHFKLGSQMPSNEVCKICFCTVEGINCTNDKEGCQCEHEGKVFQYNEAIYIIENGNCFIAMCRENGIIEKLNYECPSTPKSTTTTGEIISSTTVGSDCLYIICNKQCMTSNHLLPCPTPETPQTSITPETSIATSTTIPTCQPKCAWTQWFNLNKPTLGKTGGDNENYKDVLSSG